MTSALEELLHRVLAGRTAPDPASARVTLCGTGPETAVVVNGLAVRLVHVSPMTSTTPAFTAGQRLVLRIVVGEDATRIDVPVEVAACARMSIVLRMLGVPLVLRRRVVRDRALEDALDVRPGRSQLVA